MTATRLKHRAVIRMSSEDPEEDVLAFLQGLVTNDVTGTLPVYAGLLTPQGKTLFDFIVWPGPAGELLIDCEAGAAEDLAKRLSLYRLRRKIAIAVDPHVGVHWRPEMGDGAATDPRPLLASGDPRHLTTLMTLFSPSFPIGGFAWSHGLESAIREGQ